MKFWRLIGKIFWNKYTKWPLIIVIAIILVFKIWDYWDFRGSRGSAEPQELAREEKLWHFMGVIDKLDNDYYQTKQKSASQRDEKIDKYLTAYDVNYFTFHPLDFTKIRESAAQCLGKYNHCREQLQHIPDADQFGYRDEMLVMLALNLRIFNYSLMGDELLFNTQHYFDNKIAYDDLKEKYYKLYSRENKNSEFICLPDRSYFAVENTTLKLSSVNSAMFCIKEHSGYRLWQGQSLASLQEEIDPFVVSDADYSIGYSVLDPRGPAWIRYLECRQQNGSKCASLQLPIVRMFSLPLLYNKYMIFMTSLGGNRNPEVVQQYAAGKKDGIIINFATAQTDEERLWRLTNYLAVTADNYLWTIKFNADHKLKPSKLLAIQLVPRFGKNSSEMKRYNRILTADLQYCRRQVQSKEFQSFPGNKKSALEFFSAVEAIQQTWERYRQDKIDYKTFYRTLQKTEELYEKKRQEVLSQRWDYLYSQAPNSYVYIVTSLRTDGVPHPALKRLTEAKLQL
ncbi:MAG: hypothetical protein Q4F00_01625 [bacterium]|nr:hypothetical protein [bacterium]